MTSNSWSPLHGSFVGAIAAAGHMPFVAAAAAATPFAVGACVAGCAGAAPLAAPLAQVLPEVRSCTRCVGPDDGRTEMGGSAGGLACTHVRIRVDLCVGSGKILTSLQRNLSRQHPGRAGCAWARAPALLYNCSLTWPSGSIARGSKTVHHDQPVARFAIRTQSRNQGGRPLRDGYVTLCHSQS